MIECVEARRRLLEAEAAELAGVAESPLGAHVRDCPLCAELAQRIWAGERALSAALEATAARVAPGADPSSAREQARRAHRSRAGVWRVVIPLAAATIVGLAMFRGSSPRGPGQPSSGAPTGLVSAALSSAGPVIRSASRDVAVLPTRNPDITVVWFIR